MNQPELDWRSLSLVWVGLFCCTEYPNSVSVWSLRCLPALCGALCVPLVYLLTLELRFCHLSALGTALLVLLGESFSETSSFTIRSAASHSKVWNNICILTPGMFCVSRELPDCSVTFHVAGVCAHLLHAFGILLLPAVPQQSSQVILTSGREEYPLFMSKKCGTEYQKAVLFKRFPSIFWRSIRSRDYNSQWVKK